MVVLHCNDLMLNSSVGGAAKSLGHEFLRVTTSAELATAVSDGISRGCRVLVCIDLSSSGLDLQELANSLPPDVLREAVAYGPHVHESRLQAARELGFGQVMSRGAFSAKFPTLMQ